MPRTERPDERRKLYGGMGDGINKAVYLVTATAVWAGIGYGLDRWLGTWPILFAIGAVVGNFTGIYVLYTRSITETDNAIATSTNSYAAGVTRSMPAAGSAANSEDDKT